MPALFPFSSLEHVCRGSHSRPAPTHLFDGSGRTWPADAGGLADELHVAIEKYAIGESRLIRQDLRI